MKIVFVILHYLTVEDTKNCVESIKKKSSRDNKIIIVDNASENGSKEKLLELFQNDNQVEFIFSSTNVGFAKGNNLGINYAREKYKPDFIVVLNNDTLLLSENIETVLEREYEDSKFSVLGPLIITADGLTTSNPVTNIISSKKDIKKRISKIKTQIFLNKLHLIPFVTFFKKFFKFKKNALKSEPKKQYNVKLHGSFLVFSKEFFKNYDGFYPETFLYVEEDILFYQVQLKHLVSVFSPEIIIYHAEDSSSDIAFQNQNKYELKRNLELDSMKVYLELIQNTHQEL